MRKVLLLSYLAVICSVARASDTLTVRQVFNFDVGDTFDYREYIYSTDIGVSSVSYYRHIVTQKNYSASGDTLYFTYYDPDHGYSFDTITDLDSNAIFQIPNIYTSCNMFYTIDTGTFLRMPCNSLDISCFESGGRDIVASGLGRVRHDRSSIGSSGQGSDASGWELIYYANDSMQAGTPYYIANGSTLAEYFMPLPERCAMWTRTVTGSYSPTSPVTATVVEQIRTDSITRWAGHNLVSLLARIDNGFTGHLTQDSFIGYFYNDTLHRRAYFLTDTSAAPQTIYDLSLYNGYPQGSCGYIYLDTVQLGGVARLRAYTVDAPVIGYNSSSCCNSVIAGIGSLHGLLPITHLYNYYNGPTCGQLTDFCLCGEHIYGDSTYSSCRLLTGITSPSSSPAIQLYPNPAAGRIHISYPEAMAYGATLLITNILGQPVYTSHITVDESTHDISTLLAGLYLWRIESPTGTIRSGKLIKE